MHLQTLKNYPQKLRSDKPVIEKITVLNKLLFDPDFELKSFYGRYHNNNMQNPIIA